LYEIEILSLSCGVIANVIILLIIEQLRLPCQVILKDYTAHHSAVAASMPTVLRHHANFCCGIMPT
jgi:hypothetical protein